MIQSENILSVSRTKKDKRQFLFQMLVKIIRRLQMMQYKLQKSISTFIRMLSILLHLTNGKECESADLQVFMSEQMYFWMTLASIYSL